MDLFQQVQSDSFTQLATKFSFGDSSRYIATERLGNGQYGKVYKGKDTLTNKDVAIKKLKVIHFDQQGFSPLILRELNSLKQLKHDNVIKFKDFIIDFKKNNVLFIFQYAESDLQNFLKEIISMGQSLNKQYIQYIMRGLLSGINYMHSMGIMHRDLKPANILIVRNKNQCDWQVKLADFGLSRSINFSSGKKQFYSTDVITQVYSPPELLVKSQSYDCRVDIWSLGCIFCELIFLKPIFLAETKLLQLQKIIQYCGEINTTEDLWTNLSPDFLNFIHNCQISKEYNKEQQFEFEQKIVFSVGHEGLDLLKKMLSVNPKLRCYASDALNHPFLKIGPF